MDRMRTLQVAAVSVFAACALVLVPAAAQARIGARVSTVRATPAVVHKGAKTFQYCTAANGCWTAMFIYTKTKEFEVPEASIFGGTYTTEKIGRKTYTVFTSDIENGAQCKLTGLKNGKGYSSQAAPGKIVCEEGGTPYIEEAWWAVKV